MMMFLADLAPISAFMGFLFIVIKAFAPTHTRLMICVHIMFLSAIASSLYIIRQFSPIEDLFPPFILSFIWVVIGYLNYVEYSMIRKRDD